MLQAMLGTDEIGTASLLVMASAALLVYGINQSAWVAGLCTALELLGLAIIIAVGLPRLGTIDYFETAAEGACGNLDGGSIDLLCLYRF